LFPEELCLEVLQLGLQHTLTLGLVRVVIKLLSLPDLPIAQWLVLLKVGQQLSPAVTSHSQRWAAHKACG